MAPKAKKGGQGDRSKGAEEKREEPLQALILADSFETKFDPFTIERPRCLLPLANIPLIEYTLEFLANAGVEEAFLYCGNHTDQVEEYIQSSKWVKDTAPFALEIIRSTSRTIGDAMRDLDQKSILTGDFLCVYGDVISNISLEPALAAHRARREKDKKAIMTMVLREAGISHRTKSQSTRPAFVIDPDKARCVHYEQMRPGQKSPRLSIEAEILEECAELDVRTDLIDCGIDICTPEVLSQWSEGFDWDMPRRGFLYGVLKDHELNGLTIHVHIAQDSYAARVKNLQAYDAVSRDVISRWTYPLTPDTNLISSQTYQLYKRNVYKEDGVVLARSSNIQRRTVLGRATSVGENTTITNSVIGRRCVIGKRVNIKGAYIWDDARIGDDTVIEQAIVANEASIGKRCKLSPGALVAFGVRIADNTNVPASARISKAARADGTPQQTDTKVVGKGGEGYQVEDDEEDEDIPEGLIPSQSIYELQHLSLSNESVSTLHSVYGDEEEDTDAIHVARRSSRTESFASAGSVDSEESASKRAAASDFHHEAASSIYDGLQKGQDANDIQLELKALTLSSNADGKQVRRAVAVALMRRIASLVEGGKTPKQAVDAVLLPNELLVQRSVLDDKAALKEESIEFLMFLQTDLLHRKDGAKILLHSCFVLVNNDLIESEGVLQWWNDPRSSASEELKTIRSDTQGLVDTLAEDSEDEESEEESDSDSE
ncbi:putative translation initiation factor eif-2b epsilon subunit [Polychaeton citri CBS 116435]|uniref:Mannose-1-phosphate guanyltransferase n=1 Tax=Polychaeton citri CBS 116435 TaxID=1314669 RepID=A0A9P4QAV2_9PEZI|nr:putative translation initiation factor eif-2b epsilon subunit [Polychaeton citri CBS 116435]